MEWSSVHEEEEDRGQLKKAFEAERLIQEEAFIGSYHAQSQSFLYRCMSSGPYSECRVHAHSFSTDFHKETNRSAGFG